MFDIFRVNEFLRICFGIRIFCYVTSCLSAPDVKNFNIKKPIRLMCDPGRPSRQYK